MSGFVGLLRDDGGTVDSRLLRRLTRTMKRRGPDAQQFCIEGPVGFGRALLRTTFHAQADRWPCHLEHRLWIAGDARLDAQSDLIDLLQSSDSSDSRNRLKLARATDLELLLHAYDAWGDACVDHLLGDFAFAIWDRPRRRLFCARDHFGVKLFYYAAVDSGFVFSNTLDCLRLHPAISGALNEAAVGDFLLFGYNYEPTTTTFAAIQRLAPAHTLTWSESAVRIRRYWSLQPAAELRYQSHPEYVEQFRDILRRAVHDRLRTNRVAIHMSGGLDSPMVAAISREVLSGEGAPFDLRAHTIVYDRLIPDVERAYSTLAAEHLEIPVHHHPADDYRLFERWDRPELYRPEPWDEPFLALYVDVARSIAGHCRVALTGFDGDSLLAASWPPHARSLLANGHLSRLVADVAWYLRFKQRLPPLGIRSWLRRRIKSGAPDHQYPTWLHGPFEGRQRLRDRWIDVLVPPAEPRHCRSGAYEFLSSPLWTSIFEGYDPGVSGLPLEVRHPLIDLRLVQFALSLPPVPACVDKWLIRESGRGVLPEQVRLRPKAPLGGDLVEASLARHGGDGIALPPADGLGEYVNLAAVPKLSIDTDRNTSWMCLRTHALNRFLWASVKQAPATDFHSGRAHEQA